MGEGLIQGNYETLIMPSEAADEYASPGNISK